MINQEDDEFLKKFGSKLRNLRESRGLTLESTEELGDISWRHLQRIEHGKNINLTTALRIAKLYRIKLSDLFKGL